MNYFFMLILLLTFELSYNLLPKRFISESTFDSSNVNIVFFCYNFEFKVLLIPEHI